MYYLINNFFLKKGSLIIFVLVLKNCMELTLGQVCQKGHMLAPMLQCNGVDMIRTQLRFLSLVHILSSSNALKLTLNYPKTPNC